MQGQAAISATYKIVKKQKQMMAFMNNVTKTFMQKMIAFLNFQKIK